MEIKELHWNKEQRKIDGDFQIYSGYYSILENKPVIHLYGRNVIGERVKLNVTGFFPYFYHGNSREKILLNKPFKVPEISQKFSVVWEADIPFVRRFLIDADLPQTYVFPRILYIDIEVNMETAEILCCSFKINDGEIVTTKGESEIKEYLRSLMKEEKFDGIAGWNVKFDLEHLRKRLNFNPAKKYFVLDIYKGFKDFWHEREGLPDFTLKTVSKYLLGIEKTQIKNVLDFTEDELVEINRKDVEILYKIDTMLSISKVYTYTAFLNKALIEDSISKFIVGDIALLRESKKQNIILPTHFYSSKTKETYKGAYVFAKKGLFKNIVIFDITSAYPSAILEKNISFENVRINNESVEFDNSRKGLVPTIIEKLLDERRKHKKGTFENLAFKRLTNSIYGLLGMSISRMYNVKVAGEVTGTISEIFKKLNEYLTRKNYNVIYIDTDSCFVSDVERKDIDILQEEIQTFINYTFSYSKIKIDFEDFFPIGYLISKKQYFLQDGIRTRERGLPLRRGDTSVYLKKKYKKVLDGLLQGEEPQILLKSIFSEIKKELKDVPVTELVTPRGYDPSKKYKVLTQQKRAYRYSQEYFGYKLAFGEKVKILPIKNTPFEFQHTDVLALPDDIELIKDFEIDYDKIKESIINRINLLFPSITLEKEEKKKEKIVQSTLF